LTRARSDLGSQGFDSSLVLGASLRVEDLARVTGIDGHGCILAAGQVENVELPARVFDKAGEHLNALDVLDAKPFVITLAAPGFPVSLEVEAVDDRYAGHGRGSGRHRRRRLGHRGFERIDVLE
jgi:hypothetical protein